MYNIDLLIAFFFVGIIFIGFFFIISIFGYFFLFIIRERSKEKILKNPNLKLERFLISFGIGVSIYISYVYILNLFGLFNFFTAYLAILLFDIGFIIFYILKYKEIITFTNIQAILHKFFFKKRLILSIIIILTTSILSFLLYWSIITKSNGLLRRDPYFFMENIYYLLDTGSITLNQISFGYPSGYVIVTSGFLLIWSDYLMVFYFVKMASIFYLFLYIIISFIILKDIFKSYYLIFFSLLLLYLSNFFLKRNILNIPSTLASVLVLISMLMVTKDYPLYTQGFILAGIYLVHPLTFVFYFIVFVSYILFKIFSNIRTHKLMSKDLLMVFWMFIIILILFIPYFYNYPEEMSDIYLWYENIVHTFSSKNYPSHVGIKFNTYFLLKNTPFIDFLNTFLEKKFVDRFYNLITHTIGTFFYATILGIFLNLLIRNRKIVIFNFSVLLVLASNFLPFFFTGLNALDFFKYRTLEIFALPIIIMATFFIKGVITLFKKIVNFCLLKFKAFNHRIDTKKTSLKFLKIEHIVLLFIFLNTSYMIITRDLPEYDYNTPDEYVTIILYLRQNLEPRSDIYNPYLTNNDILNVLYDMRFYYYNLSETPTFNLFYSSVRRADYLIINRSEIPKDWITYLSNENRFGPPIINLSQFLLYSKNL